MVVKLTRIMFSGDTEMANKIIKGVTKKPSFMEKLKEFLGIGTPKENEEFCRIPAK